MRNPYHANDRVGNLIIQGSSWLGFPRDFWGQSLKQIQTKTLLILTLCGRIIILYFKPYLHEGNIGIIHLEKVLKIFYASLVNGWYILHRFTRPKPKGWMTDSSQINKWCMEDSQYLPNLGLEDLHYWRIIEAWEEMILQSCLSWWGMRLQFHHFLGGMILQNHPFLEG